MNVKNLAGVKTVSYCPFDRADISNQRLIDNASTVLVSGNFVDIPISGLAEVEVKTEIVSGQTIYTTQLRFFLAACVQDVRQLLDDLERIPSVYLFTDVRKMVYVLGGTERPFPVVLFAEQNDGIPTGRKGYNVEITYINTHSYLHTE